MKSKTATMTPARRHFLRASAQQRTASPHGEATASVRAGNTQYELMLVKLTEDRRSLKRIQSVEGKAELKRTILPEYAPWVAGVLASGSRAQDDVLMTVMAWQLDVGNFPAALEIGAYALAHNLVMPDQFQRTTATVLAEELAVQILKSISGGKAAEADIDSLLHCIELVAEHDMPDQVRAKLHKAAGLLLREREALDDKRHALSHFQRALELDSKIGVKKDAEVLERDITKLEQKQEQDQPGKTPPTGDDGQGNPGDQNPNGE